MLHFSMSSVQCLYIRRYLDSRTDVSSFFFHKYQFRYPLCNIIHVPRRIMFNDIGIHSICTGCNTHFHFDFQHLPPKPSTEDSKARLKCIQHRNCLIEKKLICCEILILLLYFATHIFVLAS